MNASAIKFDGENRYIRITDIDESSSKYKPEFPVSPNGQLIDKYLVCENDILFARTGASTGKSYLYNKDDGKLYFAGFLIRAKIKAEFNSYFVFMQTKTIQYYKWVQLMSMRSGQPGINSQEYASYSFNIPSKNEQDKITSIFILVDERIQTQKKII
ncbi:restriction endonuclease subunit S, partial [Chryseobacterium hispalense]|uniref:restriction endonuclease subunit S n=1 Tax=Chryseobacterium hispalense TaxID=1453492 RepID=UPI00391892B7